MSMVIWPVFLLLLLSLQTTWFSFFPASHSTPDFLLLFVVFHAMYGGSKKGAFCGFLVGLVQDLLTATTFGFHILTRTLIGYFTGKTKERVFKDNVHSYAVFVVVASILIKILHVLVIFIIAESGSGWFLDYVAGAFFYTVFNLLAAFPMWFVLQKIVFWLEKRNN